MGVSRLLKLSLLRHIENFEGRITVLLELVRLQRRVPVKTFMNGEEFRPSTKARRSENSAAFISNLPRLKFIMFH